MRFGDYVVMVSILLNLSAMIAYSWQGHWLQAWYWLGVLFINLSLLGMR